MLVSDDFDFTFKVLSGEMFRLAEFGLKEDFYFLDYTR